MSAESDGKSSGGAEPDPRSDPELADALRDLRAHVPPGQDPLFAAPSSGLQIKEHGESEHAVYVAPKTIPKGLRPVTPPEVKVVVLDPRKMTTGPRLIARAPNEMPLLQESLPVDTKSPKIAAVLGAFLLALLFGVFVVPRLLALRTPVGALPIESASPPLSIVSTPPPIASIEPIAEVPAPEVTEAPEATTPSKARQPIKVEPTSQPAPTVAATAAPTSTQAAPSSPSRNPTWF